MAIDEEYELNGIRAANGPISNGLENMRARRQIPDPATRPQSQGVNNDLLPQPELRANEALFRRRHIQFLILCIATFPQTLHLGISLGTGVLYDCGTRLAIGGPGSLFIAYIFRGTIVYAVMVTELNSLRKEADFR